MGLEGNATKEGATLLRTVGAQEAVASANAVATPLKSAQWSKGMAGIFIADGNYRTACEKHGTQTTRVGRVPLYLVTATGLTTAQALEVVASMEASQYYEVPAEELARLGLPP